MTEFNLSERIESNYNWSKEQIADVKEFIRLLKEEIINYSSISDDRDGKDIFCIREDALNLVFNKLAGNKLI